MHRDGEFGGFGRAQRAARCADVETGGRIAAISEMHDVVARNDPGPVGQSTRVNTFHSQVDPAQEAFRRVDIDEGPEAGVDHIAQTQLLDDRRRP